MEAREFSRIKHQNENLWRPGISVVDRGRHLLAPVLFRPVHAVEAVEIDHALSLRDRRHSVAHADHASGSWGAAGAVRAATLKSIWLATNRESVHRSVCRS